MFKKGIESRRLPDVVAGSCATPGGMLCPAVLQSVETDTAIQPRF